MNSINKLPAFAMVSLLALGLTSCASVEEPTATSKPTAASAAPTEPSAPEFGTSESNAQAIKHATDYARAAHSNGYFLSGAWAEDGEPMDEAKKFLKPYYSAEILKSLNQWDDKSHENQDFAEFMTSLVMYWADNDNYSPYEKCNEKTPKPCTLSLEQTKPKVKVDKAKDIVNVQFTQDSEFPLWSKEIDQTVKAVGSFDYDLDLALKADGAWEIVKYDIDVSFDALEPVDL